MPLVVMRKIGWHVNIVYRISLRLERCGEGINENKLNRRLSIGIPDELKVTGYRLNGRDRVHPIRTTDSPWPPPKGLPQPVAHSFCLIPSNHCMTWKAAWVGENQNQLEMKRVARGGSYLRSKLRNHMPAQLDLDIREFPFILDRTLRTHFINEEAVRLWRCLEPLFLTPCKVADSGESPKPNI